MAETVSCTKCLRASSVRRATCMYCGEPLPATDAALGAMVPSLRQLEEWERGFNVVISPPEGGATQRQVERLAEVAGMEEELARALLAAEAPLPVARVASPREAELLVTLLGASDLRARSVADSDLAPEQAVRRARAFDLREDGLEVHVASGGSVSLARSEVVLCVEGRLVSSRVELVERPGRARKRELVDTAEYFSESYVVDVYGPTLAESVRVRADAFDFGCLGAKPDPSVAANVRRLGLALRALVGEPRYDAGFGRASKLLAHAWPPSARSASRGFLRRGDLGRYAVSAIDTDAGAQFTRYSRLRYVLLGGR